jgi:hypothetical protein
VAKGRDHVCSQAQVISGLAQYPVCPRFDGESVLSHEPVSACQQRRRKRRLAGPGRAQQGDGAVSETDRRRVEDDQALLLQQESTRRSLAGRLDRVWGGVWHRRHPDIAASANDEFTDSVDPEPDPF